MRTLVILVAALTVCAAAPTSAQAVVGIVGTQTSLPQGPFRFGEEVGAELEVIVNPELVDPVELHASASFDPYELVSTPQRRTLNEGGVTRVQFRYLIQCASLACTMGPTQRQRRITFRRALLSYTTRDGTAHSTKVTWEPIVLVTRVNDPLAKPATVSQARQALPLEPLLRLPLSVKAPPPSYRLEPLTLGIVLILAALVSFGAAAIVTRPLVVLLRGKEAATPPRSPLEQALAAVESAAHRQPGSAEHREALALLARQLRRANLNELVNTARKLAWSEDAPTASASRALTSDVRARTGSAA